MSPDSANQRVNFTHTTCSLAVISGAVIQWDGTLSQSTHFYSPIAALLFSLSLILLFSCFSTVTPHVFLHSHLVQLHSQTNSYHEKKEKQNIQYTQQFKSSIKKRATNTFIKDALKTFTLLLFKKSIKNAVLLNFHQ